jgi:RNA polymerase sigma-70 factor, ECF subfamily
MLPPARTQWVPLAWPQDRHAEAPVSPGRSVPRADRRLADRLRRRDPAALTELHARFGRVVMGFLVRTLGDHAAAEDVFQQVFFQAWERGGAYDPRRAPPLAWLMAIARSRALDHLRRRVPEPRDPAGALALLEGETDAAATVDALVEQWRFADLLGRLPREEADVLRRRFYGGLTQREIAAATGIPLGTVKMRMVQALGRLRGMIDAEERGG